MGPAIIASIGLGAIGGSAMVLAAGPRSFAVPMLITARAISWFGGTAYNVNQVSLRRAITPDHLLGRMNASMRFLIWVALPLGALVGGVLGEALGLRPTIIIGILGGPIGFLWVFFSPLRTLRTALPMSSRSPSLATDKV